MPAVNHITNDILHFTLFTYGIFNPYSYFPKLLFGGSLPAPKMRLAKLDEESLAKIHDLEEQFGTVILAVEPRYAAAELDEDQLERLTALEQDLDVILIAYKKP